MREYLVSMALCLIVYVNGVMFAADGPHSSFEQIEQEVERLDFTSDLYLCEIEEKLATELRSFINSIEREDDLVQETKKARALFLSMSAFANSIWKMSEVTFKRNKLDQSLLRSIMHKNECALCDTKDYFCRNDRIDADCAVESYTNKGRRFIERFVHNLMDDDEVEAPENIEEKIIAASILYLLADFQNYIGLAYNASLEKDVIHIQSHERAYFGEILQVEFIYSTGFKRLCLYAGPSSGPTRFELFKTRNFENLTRTDKIIFNPWLKEVLKYSKENCKCLSSQNKPCIIS